MNNRAKVIKLSIMFIVTAITVITITFAWFVAMNRTDPVIIESGTLRVNALLYYGEDEDDSGVVEEDEYRLVEEGISLTNVIPGKEYLFKLEIENEGSVPGHLSINIINIIFSNIIMEDKFEVKFLDPQTSIERALVIDDLELLIFEEYVLTEETSFNFYFSIVGTKDLSSEMAYEYIKLSSFLVRLDQIQEWGNEEKIIVYDVY